MNFVQIRCGSRMVRVLYTTSLREVDQWVELQLPSNRTLREVVPVGFDIEWKPEREAGSHNTTALLQLAIGGTDVLVGSPLVLELSFDPLSLSLCVCVCVCVCVDHPQLPPVSPPPSPNRLPS